MEFYFSCSRFSVPVLEVSIVCELTREIPVFFFALQASGIFCDYAVDFSIMPLRLLERKHITVLHALQNHTCFTTEFPKDISTQGEMDHV